MVVGVKNLVRHSKEIKRELSQHLHAPMDHDPPSRPCHDWYEQPYQTVLPWIPDRTNEMHKAWGLLLQTGTGNVNARAIRVERT